MNNKIIRNILTTFIIFLTFFVGMSSAYAVKVNTYYQPDRCNGTTSASGNNLCNSNSTYDLLGGTKISGTFIGRKLGNVGLYSYSDGGKTYHAYCIEPGTSVANGYSNDGILFNNYTQTIGGKKVNINTVNNTKIKMITQVLTFAKNLGTEVNKSGNNEERYKAYAAQGLIWEIITGERTSFAPNPDGTNKPHNAISKDFWFAINSTKSGAVKMVDAEYDAILTKIRATFLSEPGSGTNVFKVSDVEAKKDPRPLNCNGTTCTLKINDSNFEHWKVSDAGGLKVSEDGKSITISTEEVIDKSTPRTIKMTIDSKNVGQAKAFYSETEQDVITIAGADKTIYLKVYTPKYQLKIVKNSKSSISQLSNLPLSNVKFDVCSDRECKKVLTSITTNKNGVATYDNIPKPGIYYVREISSIPGYEVDNSIKKVEVKNTDIVGTTSYGTIEIENITKEFNLTKKTKDEKGNYVILNDGCTSGIYTGPLFSISENKKDLSFIEIKPGFYRLAEENEVGATTRLKTCNGEFKVYKLPNCNYKITENDPPKGLTFAEAPTKNVNVCASDKNVSFTNGFAGLEFQKKDENGNLISGGKFALQMKINNVYTDILLNEINIGEYEYDTSIKDEDVEEPYIIKTNAGIAFISKLPPGDYRIVEKEAPDGYEVIEDRNSTAIITIKDSNKEDYYLTELINTKISQYGSDDYAELVVTITTGRKVPNYVVIISILIALLVITIIVRKKYKK